MLIKERGYSQANEHQKKFVTRVDYNEIVYERNIPLVLKKGGSLSSFWYRFKFLLSKTFQRHNDVSGASPLSSRSVTDLAIHHLPPESLRANFPAIIRKYYSCIIQPWMLRDL